MKKILIIEDQPQVRSNIEQILQLADFETLSAENGLEGLKLAREYKPDLILCDIMMPLLDGYGVLYQIKQEQNLTNIPFIFLTAKVDRDDFRKGMELGADDYVTKPFTPQELLTAITTRLKKQDLIQQETQTQIDQFYDSLKLSFPHELNTPLNGMLMSANLIKDYSHGLNADNYQETATDIIEVADILIESTKRLAKLTEKFLLYFQIELITNKPKEIEKLKIEYTKLDPIDITYIVVEQSRKFKRENDIKFEIHQEQIKLKIYQNHLFKIIEELANNAFKFSNVNTPVTISSLINDQEYQLSFINEGRGMTEEQIKAVGAFRQFERKKYEQQGAGLGLGIVQKILTIYDGQLKIESIINQITKFHLIIPLSLKKGG